MLSGRLLKIALNQQKNFSMKQKNIQQEVLVVTQTSFAQKALNGQNGGNKKAFPDEELEKGFWKDLLDEMLPELMQPMQGSRSELFIWQISVGEFLLLIDMAETPEIIEDSYSINPRCFLSISKMNQNENDIKNELINSPWYADN